MRMTHALIVGVASLAVNLPVWGARGGYHAVPARSFAPSAGPQVVVQRSSPLQYQARQVAVTNTASRPQVVTARQLRQTRSGEHHPYFDHDGRPIIFLPDWGYYYGPGFWDNGWYPANGPATGTASDSTTGAGVAANSSSTSVTDGTALFGQQPGTWPAGPGTSPELARANAEMTAAQADLDAARQQVRQSLAARPEYQAAVARRSAAEERIDALHASGESSYDKLLPAAQDALEARQQVTQIENAAMANDPQIAEARTRLEAAVANRSALQARAG